MQYMLLIYEDETVFADGDDTGALDRVIAQHEAFAQGLGDKLVSGAGLNATATATTVRMADGARSVHDGPFAETKEQLGGYYLIDVGDLDEAIAIAKAVPLIGNGAIEVRPVMGAQ